MTVPVTLEEPVCVSSVERTVDLLWQEVRSHCKLGVEDCPVKTGFKEDASGGRGQDRSEHRECDRESH